MDTQQLQIKHFSLAVSALFLFLLLGASTTFAGTPNDASAPDASCSSSSTIIPSPNKVSSDASSEFVAVSAVTANDIWAVGSLEYTEGGRRALVRHWNGITWADISVPSAAESVLTDVDALSSTNVWIVGYIGNQTLTLRWNGSGLTRINSPNSGSVGSALYGVNVRSAGDVWAVGSYIRGVTPWGTRPSDGLTMHWDGSSWTIVPSIGASGEQTIVLNDVHILAANDAWAVGTLTCFAAPPAGSDGSCPDPGYTNAITLHWNGSTWTNVSTGHTYYGYYESLNAVYAVAPNDVWAVGSAMFPSTPMTLHWNGQAWSYVNSPYANLTDVSGVASNSVWAVGVGSAGDMLLRWDGQSWTVAQSRSYRQGRFNALTALATNNIYLAGSDAHSDYGHQASIYQWNGTVLRNVFHEPTAVVPLENTLRAVEGSSSTDIWAVGYHAPPPSSAYKQSLIQHWNGTQWSTVDFYDCWDCSLNDVSVVSGSDAWAVGYYTIGFGRLQTMTVRWNGSYWRTAASPNIGGESNSLQAIDSISSTEVWAVGYYSDTNTAPATIRPLTMRRNGTEWGTIPTPDLGTGTDARLYDVKVLSPTEVWAVGNIKANSSAPEQTLTMRWDGTQWTRIPSPNVGPSRSILRTVAASGSNDVWAAGYYGPSGTGQVLYLHWNGTAWSVVPAPSVGTDSFILSLEQVAPNNIWAVGNYLSGGAPRTLVERWDGVSWSHVDSPSPTTTGGNYLWGVYAPPEALGNEVWSVGNYANPQGAQQTLTVRFTESLFTDVPTGSTFYPYIRCLVERNIISGYADCTFRPNNEVTRGQLSKIVSNSAGFTEDPGEQRFEDVPPTSTFYAWIQRLAARGYIGGYECGGPSEPCVSGKPYFRPNANATRGQISKIVSNAAGYSDPPTTPIFEDVPPNHTFYEWIQRLANRNIMGGYECGGVGEPCISGKPYFRPQNTATRGQTSKIVANTFFPECQAP